MSPRVTLHSQSIILIINIRVYTSSVHVLLGNDLIDRNIPLVLLPRVLCDVYVGPPAPKNSFNNLPLPLRHSQKRSGKVAFPQFWCCFVCFLNVSCNIPRKAFRVCLEKPFWTCVITPAARRGRQIARCRLNYSQGGNEAAG